MFVASLFWLAACASPARLHLHGEIALAHPESQIATGIYTGREMKEIKILGGHDLSKPQKYVVILGVGDKAKEVSVTFQNNGHSCDIRVNAESLSRANELQVTIAVPGHGKASRFFKVEDSSNFDLEFLAVMPRR